jgi:hypothetical protein
MGLWFLQNKSESRNFNKFKSPDTVTVVKVRRLEWLGHVMRMDGERTLKKLHEGKPGGGRKKEDLD